MTIEISTIIQTTVAGAISLLFASYVGIRLKQKKQEDKQMKLIHIKLEAIVSGMSAINSQYATIGRDFRDGYHGKKKELMQENNFIEE